MKRAMRSSLVAGGLLAIVLVIAVVYLVGCGERQDTPSGPAMVQQTSTLSRENPAVRTVMNIQERHTSEFMADKNVVGTATGLTEDGQVAVLPHHAATAERARP